MDDSEHGITDEMWRKEGRGIRERAGDSWILQRLADVLDPPGEESALENDPSQLGIMDDDRVLFISDPLEGDKFVVLRSGQEVDGWRYFRYYAETLDWTCYDELPAVVKL